MFVLPGKEGRRRGREDGKKNMSYFFFAQMLLKWTDKRKGFYIIIYLFIGSLPVPKGSRMETRRTERRGAERF